MTTSPNVVVADAPDRSRYEISVDGQVAGFVERRERDGSVELPHTVIDDAFEGQGLGGKLAAGVLDDLRAQGRTVIPTCTFISGWIKRHEAYVDLVPEQHRGLLDR